MSSLAFLLVLAGGLELNLEFGSETLLLASLLMAFKDNKICDLTRSSPHLTAIAFPGICPVRY